MSPSGAREDDELFQTDEPAALAFAAAHLPVGASQVGEIKERASRTAGETYLSNGCFHCDALLGNFFLFHEELLEVLVTEGTEGLRVLATVSVPVTDWEVGVDPVPRAPDSEPRLTGRGARWVATRSTRKSSGMNPSSWS